MEDAKKYPRLAVMLRQLRDLKGFTQEQVAEGADIGLKAYQSWEEGRSLPRPNGASKLAIFFSIPVEQIYAVVAEKEESAEKNISQPNQPEKSITNTEQLSEKDRRLLDIMDKWATAIVDANVTAKELAIANNSLIGIMKGGKASSVPSLEEKVDHLVQMIAAEKVGQVAVQTRLLREIAKRDGRKYEDVYNEFLDNELAEAAGVRTKANSRQGHENAGKRGKVQQTS